MASDLTTMEGLKRADLNEVYGWEKRWKSWGMERSTAERRLKDIWEMA